MYRLGEAELIYIHQGKDDNYNPVIETESKSVRCSLMDSFSVNYYQNQTRDMRKSKNIIVPKTYTFDVYLGDKRFQLEYVKLGAVKYKVMNILINRESSLTSILDCEQIINE